MNTTYLNCLFEQYLHNILSTSAKKSNNFSNQVKTNILKLQKNNYSNVLLNQKFFVTEKINNNMTYATVNKIEENSN